MTIEPRIRNLPTVTLLLIFLVLFGNPAEAGENRPDTASSPHSARKMRLQLRISEAKRKKDALRYYRSVARQQKTRKINPQSCPSPREARSAWDWRRVARRSPERSLSRGVH